MKKYITLLPLTLLTLASCGKQPGNTGLRILAPKGAPSVGLYGFAHDGRLTTVKAENVLPMFQSDQYDILVAPTHGGLKAINMDQANFKIAATITFGNLYLVKMNQEDAELSEGDKVLVFQKNNGMGKIFTNLYGDLNLTVYDASGGLDGEANSVKTTLANGGSYITDDGLVNVDYIFAAEPVITATGTGDKVYKNIQDEFKNKHSNLMITQASIFVRNGVNTDWVNDFLDKVEADITAGLADPTLIKSAIESMGSLQEQQFRFGVSGGIAYNVTTNGNKLSLGFKRSAEIKNDITNFCTIMTNATAGNCREEIIYQ